MVGYSAWDIQSVAIAPGLPATSTRAVEAGIGGLLGHNFGPVDLVLQATRQVVTRGTFTDYGKYDTRIWTTIVIPIWSPTPPVAPKPLVAKY